jgi:NAD(P)H-flavin reductase
MTENTNEGYIPTLVMSNKKYNGGNKLTLKIPSKHANEFLDKMTFSFYVNLKPMTYINKPKIEERQYTPISVICDEGTDNIYLEIVYRVYLNSFNGLSYYLNKLKEGDHLSCSYPKLDDWSNNNDKFDKELVLNKKEIIVLAGGAGITPCHQILNSIYKEINSDTESNIKKITLYNFNSNKNRVLISNELKEIDLLLSKKTTINYEYFDIFNNRSDDKKMKYLINNHDIFNNEDKLFIFSGPGPFNNAIEEILILKKNLKYIKFFDNHEY